MNQFQLICHEENESILKALLEANHISINKSCKYILCEEGVSFSSDYHILIYFRKDKITELLDIIKGHDLNTPTMLMGKLNDNFVPLNLNDIVYFNSYDNDTFANTLKGQSFKIKYKLYQLEDEVLSNMFIRINKSEIVNIKHISKIIPMFKGKLILKMDGYKQPVDISRNFVKKFKERIGM